MQDILDASRTAQTVAGQTAEFYRRLGEQVLGFQERNVRFLRSLFEEGTRRARRQTEANLAMTQELFEQAEEQREALGGLTENVMRAYWGVASSSVDYFGKVGGSVAREVVASEPRDVVLPIPGYTRLTSAQVVEKLDGLSVEELKKIRAYEMEHKNRKALLAQLEGRIQAAQ